MVSQEQIKAATEFIQSCVAFGQYNTPENLDKIWAYITGAWPNSSAANLPSSYEIAFRDLLDKKKLKAIPNWVAPISPEYRARVRNAGVAETKELYAKDAEFKRAFDLIAEEEEIERKACEADPWRWMTAQEYASIEPVSRGRLYVDSQLFRDAVQRLIDRGEL